MQDRDWVLLIGGILFVTVNPIVGIVVMLCSRTMAL
jgi:hypothetical protein